MNKIGLKYYLETIPLSKVRPYIKGNKDKYVDRLKDWFDNKWRIYLPINDSLSASKDIENEIEKEIKQALSNTQYELKDFEKGIALDTKNKREVKLGKVLNRISPELLQKFNNAESRQGKKIKNVMVVISRHPYDILGQSYDRNWTSCKDLNKGIYKEYLKEEVFLLIIAYLIYEDDKNIKKPIARVLATPYFDNTYKVYYKINKMIYGIAGKWAEAFVDTFENWLNEKQKNIVGSFKINPFVYRDQMPSQFNIVNKSKLPQWIIDSGNIPKSFDYTGENNQTFKWQNGIWEGGDWQPEGIWEDGEWRNGTWLSGGVWLNGMWRNGKWNGGTWVNGTWQDGIWKGGLWESGYWKDGVWLGGVWKSGHFFNGIWKNGDRENSVWEDGIWHFGTWYEGTWIYGGWRDGIWKSGTWKNGNWDGGTWQFGTWEDGLWEDGTWESGIWNDGTWFDGTWKKGIWYDGVWNEGTWHTGKWVKGIWKKGQIWSHNFLTFVSSNVNPRYFAELEKDIKDKNGTLEDFKKTLKRHGNEQDRT